MLLGEYHYAIDLKKRLFIPAKLRESLGDTVFLFKDLDKCIRVYSKEEWTLFFEKLSTLPQFQGRDAVRYFYASTAEVQPDAQGRILIPKNLCEYAGLTQNAVVIGCGKYAEIWAEDEWTKFSEKQYAEVISESLAQIGM